MGRGPGRARSLTQAEAFEAMEIILSGQAAPEATGALLMLMRYRGEIPEEIAGFVQALRGSLDPWPGKAPALDWPSYAAGRTRGAPWFLLAAKLVARAGHSVLLHGWNSHQSQVASVRGALDHAGIETAQDFAGASTLLARDGIAYLPLESFAPKAYDLLRLRDILGLRSAINTCLRVLNPGGAQAAVQGVFHPPYRELQSNACALLGLNGLTVIKGGGGEFERHPGKDAALYGLRDGALFETSAAATLDEPARKLADMGHEARDLARLWSGELSDGFAREIVLSTAALALETLGEPDGEARARALWQERLSPMSPNAAR
ncbi:MAG: anthranilate phosphoribosyltransferase [Halocynthiibacter sp.]|jgi:anthranilate phosphoribosyltransferase